MIRVLIVDDKEENLYYLDTLLGLHGCQVESARHGAEAMTKARQSPPDVVISDLLMPVMDGYTLLRHWKADVRLQSVPFIVYTATYTDPEDEHLALSLGADAFILKPTEPEEFLARLDAVRGGEKAVAPTVVPPPEADSAGMLREYSEVLIRKLEQKSIELEESNRSLQRDMAAREQAEQALREAAVKLQKTEEQLRQAQKMEAVGRLAGGVAHDFNNLLSVILGYTSLLLDELKPGDRMREEIQEVSLAGERAAELTRQLLVFSRQQVLQPKVIDLSQVVSGLEKMLRRVLGEDIEFALSAPRGVGNVYADPSQIEQIVMNLVVNARDAMPCGGKLSVEATSVELDEDELAGRSGGVAGRFAVLTVTDTGTGMDAATRARIFEPFFTTKEVGQGTGLGLSTVFGIVNQSGGYLTVDSELGVGTTFKMYLPCTDRAPANVSSPSLAPPALRGSETILLVEDDEQVRVLNCAILRRNGYHVLEAADGVQALQLSQTFAGNIHLLLVDVVMPHMGGRELAARLGSFRPGTKVIYVSGYTEDTVLHHGVLEAGLQFLQKPITPDTLLRKLREVLTVG